MGAPGESDETVSLPRLERDLCIGKNGDIIPEFIKGHLQTDSRLGIFTPGF